MGTRDIHQHRFCGRARWLPALVPLVAASPLWVACSDSHVVAAPAAPPAQSQPGTDPTGRGTVLVEVRDEEGTPVPGARVTLYRFSWATLPGVETDASGRASLDAPACDGCRADAG